jgi:hypothetical protein
MVSSWLLLQEPHGVTTQKTPFFITSIYLFCIYLCGAVMDPSPLLLRSFIGLLYQPWMIDGDDCGAVGGMNEWQDKPKYWVETCPSAALSTTDPI